MVIPSSIHTKKFEKKGSFQTDIIRRVFGVRSPKKTYFKEEIPYFAMMPSATHNVYEDWAKIWTFQYSTDLHSHEPTR